MNISKYTPEKLDSVDIKFVPYFNILNDTKSAINFDLYQQTIHGQMYKEMQLKYLRFIRCESSVVNYEFTGPDNYSEKSSFLKDIVKKFSYYNNFVCNSFIASLIEDMASYHKDHAKENKIEIHHLGEFMGMEMYCDPYMAYSDNSLLFYSGFHLEYVQPKIDQDSSKATIEYKITKHDTDGESIIVNLLNFKG